MLNDATPCCRVAVAGSVSGRPFVVLREVRRGKTTRLELSLDGADVTQQDKAATQELIDRTFNTELLRCAVFFGQNDITQLLEVRHEGLPGCGLQGAVQAACSLPRPAPSP